MTYKTIKRLLMLPMAALIVLFPAPQVFAQNVSLNKVYDFSGNADTLNSQINFVYADSNRIIALGEAYPEHENPHAFVAAFNYAGNLLWQKPILLPNGLISLADGFDNLKKVKPNVYAALGNIPNVPKANGITSYEPFLYFFNSNGDSLNTIRFPSDSLMRQRMTALTVNSTGEIIVGGVSSLLGADSNSIYPRNYWFVSVNNTGNLLNNSTFPLVNQVYMGAQDPEITKILVSPQDSIKYIAVANTYSAIRGGILIDIDSQLNFKNYEHFEHGLPQGSNLPNTPILLFGSNPFEFNFIKRKNTQYSFYWTLPALIPEPEGAGPGIYYAKGFYRAINVQQPYQLQWDRAFRLDTTNLPAYTGFPGALQGRSSLAEAINGDMLLQKEAGRPSDSLNPLVSHSGYFLPAMLRVDSNGNTRWGRTFQYVHSADSGLYHSFNDLSVAPDGRIVMAGYLRSRYSVPGYDTAGTVSWLLVLSDSVHDHQQPPESIHLSGLGQKVEATVYPNPTLDQATVAFQNFKGRVQDITLNVQDFSGKRVQIRKCTNLKESISLNSYAPGIYFITILYLGKPAGTLRLVKY